MSGPSRGVLNEATSLKRLKQPRRSRDVLNDDDDDNDDGDDDDDDDDDYDDDGANDGHQDGQIDGVSDVWVGVRGRLCGVCGVLMQTWILLRQDKLG